MKIFISWSGELSRNMAEALRDWLRFIFQSVKPWVSSKDLRKGSRWLLELSKKLDDTNFGLLCVTPEALESPWLNFEAGAIGKKFSRPKTAVIGILFGIPHANVKGPISHFQNVEFGKDGMLEVVKEINAALQSPLEPQLLSTLFESFWPKLEEAYKQHSKNIHLVAPPGRSERELLEEILSLVKNQEETVTELKATTRPDPFLQHLREQEAWQLVKSIQAAESLEQLGNVLGLHLRPAKRVKRDDGFATVIGFRTEDLEEAIKAKRVPPPYAGGVRNAFIDAYLRILGIKTVVAGNTEQPI